jgi:hypothetical protein
VIGKSEINWFFYRECLPRFGEGVRSGLKEWQMAEGRRKIKVMNLRAPLP